MVVSPWCEVVGRFPVLEGLPHATGPNASLQLLPKAEATKERRLEAVSCKALLGMLE